MHEAIEYPIQAGGMHLKAVNERADAMVGITQNFCTSLAQIIVTIMEQIKGDVVAGSDGVDGNSDAAGALRNRSSG